MKNISTWLLIAAITIFLLWVFNKFSEIKSQVRKKFDDGGDTWVEDFYGGPFDTPDELPNPDDLSDKQKKFYNKVTAEATKQLISYSDLYESGEEKDKFKFIDELNIRQQKARDRYFKMPDIEVYNRWKNEGWYNEKQFRIDVGAKNQLIWSLWKIYAKISTAINPINRP
jgi:hypothetical protein